MQLEKVCKLKKAITILLLLSISIVYILRPIGLSIYQKIWKTQIYLSLKSEVKKHHLETIIINKSDLANSSIQFERIDKGEFKLNGMMYDIVEEEENANQIKFLCFLDIKEMVIISALLNNLTHSGSLLPIKAIINYTLDTFYLTTIFLLIYFSFKIKSIQIKSKISSKFFDIPNPPPNFKLQ